VSAGPGFRRRRAEHGVRGFAQPLDEFHDPGKLRSRPRRGVSARGELRGDGCAGLEQAGEETEWATESPAIRAVPSSMLSTLPGKADDDRGQRRRQEDDRAIESPDSEGARQTQESGKRDPDSGQPYARKRK
jgi:hypothetical protein